MQEVIIIKGLPGCGKSTTAKQWMKDHPGNYIRLSKDSMREQLHFSVFSRKNENYTVEARNALLRHFLAQGMSVIIDDTNLNPVHEEDMRTITKEVEDSYDKGTPRKINISIFDMTDVGVEKCVKNDLQRKNSVGRDVIEQNYSKWIQGDIPPSAR